MAPVPHNLLSVDRLPKDVTHLGNILSRALSGRPTAGTGPSSPLARRAQMVSIPSTYSGITDSPGIVVAIVLATVCGFILLIWLLALVFSPRGPFPPGDSGTVTTSSETSRTRSYTRSRRAKSRRRRPEVVEVQESVSGVSGGRDEEYAEVYDEEDYDSPPHSPRRSYRRGSGHRTINPRRYGG